MRLPWGPDGMRSYYRVAANPDLGSPYVGFRIASIAVPEPALASSLVLCTTIGFGFCRRRSTSRNHV